MDDGPCIPKSLSPIFILTHNLLIPADWAAQSAHHESTEKYSDAGDILEVSGLRKSKSIEDVTKTEHMEEYVRCCISIPTLDKYTGITSQDLYPLLRIVSLQNCDYRIYFAFYPTGQPLQMSTLR